MALTANRWELLSHDAAMAHQLPSQACSRLSVSDASTPLDASFDKALSLKVTYATESAAGNAGFERASTGLSARERRSSDIKYLPSQEEARDQDEDLFRAGGAMDLEVQDPNLAPPSASVTVPPSIPSALNDVSSGGEILPLPSSISANGRAISECAAASSFAAAQEAVLSEATVQPQQWKSGSGWGAGAAPSLAAQPGFSAGPSIGDLPVDEAPSRMLFVRNLNPTTAADELRRTFEAYGDVRTIYSACIGGGFCMISYYDLRAACLASHSLQGTLLAGNQLDVHFSSPRDDGADCSEGDLTLYNLDPTTTVEQLYQSFISFGDVKDIVAALARGSGSTRIIQFYDVRHAAAAYQALSQGAYGGHSKRHSQPHFFDMAALPSVPEVNVQNMTTNASDESLRAMAGAAEGRSSHRVPRDPGSSAIPTGRLSPSHRLHSSMSTLGAHSGGNLSVQGDVDLSRRLSLGPVGSPPGNAGGGAAWIGASLRPDGGSDGQLATFGGKGGVDVDSMRRFSGGLPRVRLSASNSQDHLQRLSSSGVLTGVSPMMTAITAGHVSAFARSVPITAPSPRAIGSGALSDGFHSGSFGAATSFGGGGAMPSVFSSPGIDTRLGSLDMALMGSRQAAPAAANSAAAQRLHAFTAEGGLMPNSMGCFDVSAANGGQPVGGALGSASAHDLAALYEAQQVQLAQQHEQLMVQQQVLQNLGASANSFSAGTSPSQSGWAQIHAQQQALLQGSASAGRMSAMHLQAVMAVQQANSGTMPPPVSMHRSRSASAMTQLNAEGLFGGGSPHCQGGMGQHGGRLGGGRRSEDNSMGNGLSGRLPRRMSAGQSISGPALERRSTQDRLYSLDLDRVLAGRDGRTTLMIKNIPNKYTQKMLLATIDELFRGTYDFFYLPIDFKNRCNVGYAFINLLQPCHVVPLVERFNNRKWEKFNSEKVCNITYARIQGKNAMVAHFQNSSLLHEDKRCRPVLFHSDGALAGEAEPFPVGPAMRLRPARAPTRDTHREHKLREREGPW